MKKKTKSKAQKKPKKSMKKKVPAKKNAMKKFMANFSKAFGKKKPAIKMKKAVKKAKPVKKVTKKMKPVKKMIKKAPKKPAKVMKAKKKKSFHHGKALKPLKSKPLRLKPLKLKPLQDKKPKLAQPTITQPELVEKLVDTALSYSHEPVLVEEVLDGLELGSKKVVVDGTLGLGGHAKKLLEDMSPDGKLIGFDVDDDNMAVARKNLESFGDRVIFVRSNFSHLAEELSKLKFRSCDAILLDLGLSSPQVDNPEKGFSFLREGPLDMRFDKTQQLTAAEVINSYGQNELIRIFREYGEESYARKIAQEITRRRKARSFKTTTELANFIEKLIGRKGHIHPATRVFQALRIEVNHELDVLLETLKQAVTVLKKHGRIAVIAYHSLEDRVVKQFFRECARDYINEPDKLTTTHLEPTLYIVTKKPIVPTIAEISKNPRSRSAKLRIAEKI